LVMNLADSVTRLVNIMALIGKILLLIHLPLFLFRGYQIPWLMITILVLAPHISALLQLALSRTREFDADLEAVKLTGDPGGLASGLQKFERLSDSWFDRLFLKGSPVPELSWLRTHPATEERIRRLLELERVLVLEELSALDGQRAAFRGSGHEMNNGLHGYSR